MRVNCPIDNGVVNGGYPMALISLKQYHESLDDLLASEAREEVVYHCRHILTQYPRNAMTQRLLGQALVGLGRWDEAATTLRRALGTLPLDVIAHHNISVAYEQLGQIDAALWHQERCFDQQPADGATVSRLKDLYEQARGKKLGRVQLTTGAVAQQRIRNGLYNQATELLSTAIETYPTRLDLVLIKAQAHWYASEYVEAAENALKVLDTYPYCLAANQLMTEFWLNEGRPSDAQRFLSRIEDVDPYLAITLATGQPADADRYTIEALDYERATHRQLSSEEPEWLAEFDSGHATEPAAMIAAVSGDLGADEDDFWAGDLADAPDAPDAPPTAAAMADPFISDRAADDVGALSGDSDALFDDLFSEGGLAETDAPVPPLTAPDMDDRMGLFAELWDEVEDEDEAAMDLADLAATLGSQAGDAPVPAGRIDSALDAIAEGFEPELDELDYRSLEDMSDDEIADLEADLAEGATYGMTGLLASLEAPATGDEDDWLNAATTGELDEPRRASTGLTGLLGILDQAEEEIGQAQFEEPDPADDDIDLASWMDPFEEAQPEVVSFADDSLADPADGEDPLAWIALEDETPAPQSALPQSDLLPREGADPLAWMSDAGVEIEEGSVEQLFDEEYDREDDYSIAPDQSAPLAWLAATGTLAADALPDDAEAAETIAATDAVETAPEATRPDATAAPPAWDARDEQYLDELLAMEQLVAGEELPPDALLPVAEAAQEAGPAPALTPEAESAPVAEEGVGGLTGLFEDYGNETEPERIAAEPAALSPSAAPTSMLRLLDDDADAGEPEEALLSDGELYDELFVEEAPVQAGIPVPVDAVAMDAMPDEAPTDDAADVTTWEPEAVTNEPMAADEHRTGMLEFLGDETGWEGDMPIAETPVPVDPDDPQGDEAWFPDDAITPGEQAAYDAAPPPLRGGGFTSEFNSMFDEQADALFDEVLSDDEALLRAAFPEADRADDGLLQRLEMVVGDEEEDPFAEAEAAIDWAMGSAENAVSPADDLRETDLDWLAAVMDIDQSADAPVAAADNADWFAEFDSAQAEPPIPDDARLASHENLDEDDAFDHDDAMTFVALGDDDAFPAGDEQPWEGDADAGELVAADDAAPRSDMPDWLGSMAAEMMTGPLTSPDDLALGMEDALLDDPDALDIDFDDEEYWEAAAERNEAGAVFDQAMAEEDTPMTTGMLAAALFDDDDPELAMPEGDFEDEASDAPESWASVPHQTAEPDWLTSLEAEDEAGPEWVAETPAADGDEEEYAWSIDAIDASHEPDWLSSVSGEEEEAEDPFATDEFSADEMVTAAAATFAAAADAEPAFDGDAGPDAPDWLPDLEGMAVDGFDYEPDGVTDEEALDWMLDADEEALVADEAPVLPRAGTRANTFGGTEEDDPFAIFDEADALEAQGAWAAEAEGDPVTLMALMATEDDQDETGNAPDWLNAMVPGLGMEDFVDEPADGSEERPLVASEADFAWLTDLVNDETAQVPVVMPAPPDMDALPATTASPLLAFPIEAMPVWVRALLAADAAPGEALDEVVDEMADDAMPSWLEYDDEDAIPSA
jgi:tetratricopeptide (TPR) repeat protein